MSLRAANKIARASGLRPAPQLVRGHVAVYVSGQSATYGWGTPSASIDDITVSGQSATYKFTP